MRVIRLTITIFVMISVVLVACSNPATSTTSPIESITPTQPSDTSTIGEKPKLTIASKTYTNSENLFSVEYPKDWDLEENVGGIIAIFAGPLTKENRYMVNINIVSENLTRNITIQDYIRLGELKLKKSVPDYIKLEEYATTISGQDAIIRTFTATVQNVLLKDTQAYLIKGKKAYVITYDVDDNSYDEYSSFFDLVISTFNFH
jgi:hypothetical protein